MISLRNLTALSPVILACSALAAPAIGSDDRITEIVVNGEVISGQAILREMVYRIGSRELESRKLEIFIQKELERRELAASDFVSDEEVEELFERQLAQIDEEYKGKVSQETVLKTNRLSVGSVRKSTKLSLLFNRVFLPDNPSEWPDISRSALIDTMDDEQGELFFDKMQEGYQLRQSQGETTDSSQGQMMFNAFLRQPIIAALAEQAQILTPSDGIPDRLAMTVYDVEVTTDEMFERIKANAAIPAIEWERTRMWLAKMTAVRQDLQARGHYLDDERFGRIWADLEAQYAGSIVPIEQLAMGIKRFPSLDSYRLFERALKSYERSIADEITDADLSGHLYRATRLLGLEQVDLDVILLSAYGFEAGEWIEDGWEKARSRATEVARKLGDGEDWDVLLEQYSDFWDPPVPASKQGQQGTTTMMRRKGRLGFRNRNTLMPLLDESAYICFLAGHSVTDTVFFEQEVDTVAGPYRGPYGYYITRVNARKPPTKAFGLDDPIQRKSVRQDYVDVRFAEYASGLIEKAAIQGI